MAAYTAGRGVRFAPHGKTMMSPRIAEMQLAAGAWGITAATPTQLRVYRDAGVQRLILANQLVDPNAVAWLRSELDRDPAFECAVFVDSPAGLDLLEGPGIRPLPVLVEIGHPGGRTGVRSITAAEELAAEVRRRPGLRLAGLAAYEGSLGGDPSPEVLAAVRAFSREIGACATKLLAAGVLPEDGFVTIGGSAFFDAAIDGLVAGGLEPARVVLRSGAYVTHDDGFYRRMTPRSRGAADAPELRAALTLWAPVLSRPEPGLALLLCGRRDVGFDQGLPKVRGARNRDGSDARPLEGTITQLADQHAFLEVADDADLAVGDLVELGISHPCTTVDRWGSIPILDRDHRIVEVIRTRFA
ncbi:amino acid deaminase [Leucobacter iarius]|uniref:Amino acid deaminase n=2 Tax=Leucobacter iarius TaxID=333963 RepID=A0ABN2L810_9MICO